MSSSRTHGIGLALIGLCLAACSTHGSKVSDARREPAMITGNDDRQETIDVEDARLRQWADSVPALVNEIMIDFPIIRRRPLMPDLTPYSDTSGKKICPEERFAAQPAFSRCSAALVAPNLILTAGHCMRTEQSCSETLVVFGYRIGRDRALEPIPRSEAYRCTRIVARHWVENASSPLDYALFELDRPVQGHRPLRVSRSMELPDVDTPVATIGYPSGLPQKIVRGGKVLYPRNNEVFPTSLDTFKGLSGGPVFNELTGDIIGLNSRGYHINYEEAPGRGCLVPFRCTNECISAAADASTFRPLLPFIPE